ncbi:MAG: NUDIX hydrolase [Rhodospirillaceae bacterium]
MNRQDSRRKAETVHCVGAGVVVLRERTAGPEVLLIRRGKAPKAGEWSIPGGRQEHGETAREAAKREVAEETTLTVETLGPLEVVEFLNKDSESGVETHWTLIDFYTRDAVGTAQAGTDAAEVRWVPFSKLSAYGLWTETERVIRKAAALPWPPLET